MNWPLGSSNGSTQICCRPSCCRRPCSQRTRCRIVAQKFPLSSSGQRVLYRLHSSASFWPARIMAVHGLGFGERMCRHLQGQRDVVKYTQLGKRHIGKRTRCESLKDLDHGRELKGPTGVLGDPAPWLSPSTRVGNVGVTNDDDRGWCHCTRARPTMGNVAGRCNGTGSEPQIPSMTTLRSAHLGAPGFLGSAASGSQ